MLGLLVIRLMGPVCSSSKEVKAGSTCSDRDWLCKGLEDQLKGAMGLIDAKGFLLYEVWDLF